MISVERMRSNERCDSCGKQGAYRVKFTVPGDWAQTIHLCYECLDLLAKTAVAARNIYEEDNNSEKG